MLSKCSVPHKTVPKQLKVLLKKVQFYMNFSNLALFNIHVLMYALKRHAPSYSGYQTRMQLAIIDHNYHLTTQTTTPDGSPRYKYRKGQQEFRKIYSSVNNGTKTYGYILELIERVFMRKVKTKGSMKENISLDEDDPRRSHHCISPLPRPSAHDLVKQQNNCLELKS